MKIASVWALEVCDWQQFVGGWGVVGEYPDKTTATLRGVRYQLLGFQVRVVEVPLPPSDRLAEWEENAR